MEEEYVDWVISGPTFSWYCSTWSVLRSVSGVLLRPANRDAHCHRQYGVGVHNLIILGGAVAVSVESKQVRVRTVWR